MQTINFVKKEDSSVTFTLNEADELQPISIGGVNPSKVVYIYTDIQSVRQLWLLMNTCDYLMRAGCRFEIEIKSLFGASNPTIIGTCGYSFEIIAAMLASCGADYYKFHSIDNEIAQRILESVLYAEFVDNTEE